MTTGFLDSASATEVISLLRRDQENVRNSTAYTALEVTCLLIKPEPFRMAPGFSEAASAGGIYGSLIRQLRESGILFGAPIIGDAAINVTRSQIRSPQSHASLRNYFSWLMSNDEFLDWVEEDAVYNWPEHANRLRGLYDPEFIPEISLITQRDEAELKKAWRHASDPIYVSRYASEGGRHGDEFDILREAFAASALIRGSLHDEGVRPHLVSVPGDGTHEPGAILHHPMRRAWLSEINPSGALLYEAPPDPTRFLANAVLALAMTEKGVEGRLAAWVNLVGSVRKLALSGEISLDSSAVDEDTAKTVAVQILRRAGVTRWSKTADRAYDWLWNLAASYLTAFILMGFGSFLAAVVLTQTARPVKSFLSNKIPALREGQLRSLAEKGPGRAEGLWKRANPYMMPPQ